MAGSGNPTSDGSSNTQVSNPDVDAFISSLAADHDDLGSRLRTVTAVPASARPDVAVHAHYFPFRGGKPTMEEFVEILSTKLIGFCLPRREIHKAAERWATMTPPKVMEDAVRLHNRALDLFKKANHQTNRNGEFGEVITYLLIESVLNRPPTVRRSFLRRSPLPTDHR